MPLHNLLEFLKSACYFIGVLSVLVIAHEWGHYAAAKLCKMKVEDFSLFFGRKLITLGKWNGTEYNIRTVPLGGFVKVTGMEPEEAYPLASSIIPSNWPSEVKAKYNVELIGLEPGDISGIAFADVSEPLLEKVSAAVTESARIQEAGKEALQLYQREAVLTDSDKKYLDAVFKAIDRVKPPDPDGYNQRPLHQRASVIFAGPLVSLLFGYLLFCVMGFTTGLPDEKDRHLAVGYVAEGKPAQKAGLQAGDYVVAVNGTPCDGLHALAAIRRSISPADHKTPLPLKIEVVREGKNREFTVVPDAERDYMLQESGDAVKGPDGKPIIGTVGMIGIGVDQVWKRYSIGASILRGTELIKLEITGTLQNIFSRKVKDNVGGIISIGRVISQNRQQGNNHVLFTAALLSVSLGILNLFPIPVLDGGHLMLLSFEFLLRRRLTAKEVYSAQLVGICIIGALFVMVMYMDIMRMIKH
jgi:regulator of sigma E protease